MINFVAPIVAASLMGAAFVVFLIFGLFRAGHSTQQLRWVFGMWFLLASAIGFGAIANDQGFYTRTSTDGVLALWDIPTIWTITIPFACAMLTCALFQTMGARLAPPMLTFASMVCLALGVFLPLGWALWY